MNLLPRLLPTGLVYGKNAREMQKKNLAFNIAGGWVYATGVQLFHRDSPSKEPEFMNAKDFIFDKRPDVCEVRSNLASPRKSVSAIAMNYPAAMGIINITPDSFSDGGTNDEFNHCLNACLSMIEEGVKFIDIGGESTRPGAKTIAPEEELQRVTPILNKLKNLKREYGATKSQEFPAISLDTRKSLLMKNATQLGVDLINDVSAFSFDRDSIECVKNSKLPVILMHAQGIPENMQANPNYANVVDEVYYYLESKINQCIETGIDKHRIIVDPGIGFGKTTAHNLELIRNISTFHGLGVPIALGASRKRFIGEITETPVANKRLIGSIVSASEFIKNGIQILRVHDTNETIQAIKMEMALLS